MQRSPSAGEQKKETPLKVQQWVNGWAKGPEMEQVRESVWPKQREEAVWEEGEVRHVAMVYSARVGNLTFFFSF